MTTAEHTHETSLSSPDESLYPHQASEGPLSPRDLADHVAQHPEQYHDALVDDHIRPFIGKYGLDLVTDEHGNMQAEHTRSVDDIIAILWGENEGVLGTEDAHRLIETGQGWAVAKNLANFTGLDHSDIAHHLIEADRGRAVAENLTNFTGLDHSDIAHHLIEADQGWAVADNLEKFTGLDHSDIAHHLIEADRGRAVAENLATFTGLDHADIAHHLIEADQGWVVADNLTKFTGLDASVAHRLIKAGNDWSVADNLANFTGLDRVSFVVKLLVASPETVRYIPDETLQEIVQSQPERFAHIGQQLEQLLGQDDIAEDAFETHMRVLDYAGGDKPAAVQVANEMLGAYSGLTSIKVIQGILSGKIPQEAQKFGVTVAGEQGVGQLKNGLADFLHQLQSGDISQDTEELIEHSSLARGVFMQMMEFKSLQGYGNHDEQTLVDKLAYRNQAVRDGRIAPMPEEYVPSRQYEISTLASKKDTTSWSPDVVERYEALHSDIKRALAIIDAPQQGFSRHLDGLRIKIGEVLNDIETQLHDIDDTDEKASFKRDNLTKRKDKLERYVATIGNGEQKRFIVNAPAEFERGFMELQGYAALHSDMRALIFAGAMRKHPGQVEAMRGLADADISIDDIAAMREFIEHIVNQETYGEHFGDKKSASAFRKMSSTKALEEAMQRHAAQAGRGKAMALQFVPSRGTLLEISGQIGDACWADKNQSIAEAMPNMSAIIMRARPGTKQERIIGSALLIETTNTETGEGVLVLRGTNPRENYINKVDVGEFFDAISDYVRQIAEQRGLTPAVVIDDHSGGSASNRPVLFGYMSAKSKDMQRLPVDGTNTWFNGYNITRDTYAL